MSQKKYEVTDDLNYMGTSRTATMLSSAAGMTVSSYFNRFEKLNPEETLKLLKARRNQHINMANYLEKDYLPFLSKDKQKDVTTRLSKEILPLIKKADQMIAQVEGGRTDGASRFLQKELHEVTSEIFQRQSLNERNEEIKKLFPSIEEAIACEDAVVQDLTKSINNSADVKKRKLADASKSIEDSKSKIEKYYKLMEALEALQYQPWTPLPLITISNENRTVNTTNVGIEANILQVGIKCVLKCPTNSYRLTGILKVDSNNTQQFQTEECEYATGVWNFQTDLTVAASGASPDADFSSKEIKIELIDDQSSCCFWSNRVKARSSIPLTKLRDENNVNGRVAMDPNSQRYEVEYTLKLRDPLERQKRKKFCIVTLNKTFPKLEINAEPKHNPDTSQSKQQSTQPSQAQSQQKAVPEQKPQGEEPLGALVLTKTAANELKAIDKANYPEGVSEEDILHPDNPEKNKCYSFLQELQAQLEKAKEKMMSGFGNMSEAKAIRDKWSAAYNAFMALESALQSGNMDPEEYFKSISAGLDRDKKIMELYSSKNLATYTKFMACKIELVQKEVNEMKEQMPGL